MLTSTYLAQPYTPALATELAAVIVRCRENPNLELAVGELLAATQSKAATAMDAEITSDVAQMDVERARAELIVMIGSYRRLLRASAALLLGNAEGQIWSRKKVATKAASAARPKIKAAKLKAEQLWQERYKGMHPKLRTNEQFATECLRRWPEELPSIGTVTNWCTEWNKKANQNSRC